MIPSVKLNKFKEYGSRIRVTDSHVVSGMDRSELSHLLGTYPKMPDAFMIEGKDGVALVRYSCTERDADGDVLTWLYTSTDMVKTAVGHRRVAITIYND